MSVRHPWGGATRVAHGRGSAEEESAGRASSQQQRRTNQPTTTCVRMHMHMRALACARIAGPAERIELATPRRSQRSGERDGAQRHAACAGRGAATVALARGWYVCERAGLPRGAEHRGYGLKGGAVHRGGQTATMMATPRLRTSATCGRTCSGRAVATAAVRGSHGSRCSGRRLPISTTFAAGPRRAVSLHQRPHRLPVAATAGGNGSGSGGGGGGDRNGNGGKPPSETDQRDRGDGDGDGDAAARLQWMQLRVHQPWALLGVPVLLCLNKLLIISTRPDPASRNAAAALCDVVRGPPPRHHTKPSARAQLSIPRRGRQGITVRVACLASPPPPPRGGAARRC
eukprot:scaffold31_cov312-Prasinococcus_capsulatus_cf.AAC.6